MISDEQAAIYGNFRQILDMSKNLVLGYEKLMTLPEITRQIPQAETALIDAIIIHVAKLFSNSKNEPFRLKRFKAICRIQIRQELEELEAQHKDTIGKVVSNRNKLVAHLDERFYEMCFSTTEIQRMMRAMADASFRNREHIEKIFADMPRAASKKDERYTIADFRNDLPEIRQMLVQLEVIWKRALPLEEEQQINNFERNASGYLSLSLRFAREYRDMLCALRRNHGEVGIQISPELTIYHRALWTALIIEIRKLFGASFKQYRNFSLREINFFKTPPYKEVIDEVYGDQTIQNIIRTSNTFTAHLGEKNVAPISTKDICESNLEKALERLQTPIDAFAKYQRTK